MENLSHAPAESASCPEADVLAAYLDRGLSEEERRSVEPHLEGCEGCYTVFVDTVAALDHVGTGSWSRFTRRQVGIGVSLAAAAGLAALLLRPIGPGVGPSSLGRVNP